MTDYAKMARECQNELEIVERKLKRARTRCRKSSSIEDKRAMAILEDIRFDLKVKEKEFRRRAGLQNEQE